MASEFIVPAATKGNGQQSFQRNQHVFKSVERRILSTERKIVLNITSPTSAQNLSAGIRNYTGMVPFAHVDSISESAT